MTTEPRPIQERIARALYGDAYTEGRYPGDWRDENPAIREHFLARSAAVLPIIAAEVRKAQADAWDEGYGDCWTYHQSEGMKGTETNPHRE